MVLAARRSKIFIPVLLIASYGLSVGEALGMQQADIDWTSGTLTIRRTVRQMGAEISTQDIPEAQRRRLSLRPIVALALRDHESLATAHGGTSGNPDSSDGFICVAPDGRLIKPNGLRRSFAQLVRDVGLPHTTLRDIRKGHAAALISRGVDPAIVARVLGLSRASVSAIDRFSHIRKPLPKDYFHKRATVYARVC
ncbi:MAG: tyrosine-type recombinase/integrase [Chloroflexi bacterium]|nr:tyrosine-type recombinase/integrase [Chloroflexota bacterium]